MAAKDAVDDLLETPDPGLEWHGRLVGTLIELEDEMKKIFGLEIFE